MHRRSKIQTKNNSPRTNHHEKRGFVRLSKMLHVFAQTSMRCHCEMLTSMVQEHYRQFIRVVFECVMCTSIAKRISNITVTLNTPPSAVFTVALESVQKIKGYAHATLASALELWCSFLALCNPCLRSWRSQMHNCLFIIKNRLNVMALSFPLRVKSGMNSFFEALAERYQLVDLCKRRLALQLQSANAALQRFIDFPLTGAAMSSMPANTTVVDAYTPYGGRFKYLYIQIISKHVAEVRERMKELCLVLAAIAQLAVSHAVSFHREAIKIGQMYVLKLLVAALSVLIVCRALRRLERHGGDTVKKYQNPPMSSVDHIRGCCVSETEPDERNQYVTNQSPSPKNSTGKPCTCFLTSLHIGSHHYHHLLCKKRKLSDDLGAPTADSISLPESPIPPCPNRDATKCSSISSARSSSCQQQYFFPLTSSLSLSDDHATPLRSDATMSCWGTEDDLVRSPLHNPQISDCHDMQPFGNVVSDREYFETDCRRILPRAHPETAAAHFDRLLTFYYHAHREMLPDVNHEEDVQQRIALTHTLNRTQNV